MAALDTSNRSRIWGGTLNNYTEDDVEFVKQFGGAEHIRAYCATKEVGAEGTPHIQLAFRSSNKFSLAGLKKKFGDRWHWDAHTKYAEYPLKFDSVVILLRRAVPSGSTSSLLRAKAAMDDGMSLRDFRSEHFGVYARYGKLYARYMSDGFSHRDADAPPRVVWLHGPSGCGKSRIVRELVQRSGRGVYIHNPDGRWWDRYQQEPIVCLDDYRKSDYDWSFLLRLTDRYPVSVPSRGMAPIPFNSPLIIFTCVASSDLAHEWHGEKQGTWDTFGQLERRIHHEWDVSKTDKETILKTLTDFLLTR